MAQRWMSSAVNPARKGQFTAKAKAAGMGVQEYAGSVLGKGSKASTRTKRQAAFARTAKKISTRRKRSPAAINRAVRRGRDFRV